MRFFSPFTALCTVGFFARLSYALARSPVLPLFALYLGAGPEAIGFAVGISTVTGIFFKLPSGALSDVIGRKRTMLIGLVVFAVLPFAYLLIDNYSDRGSFHPWSGHRHLRPGIHGRGRRCGRGA